MKHIITFLIFFLVSSLQLLSEEISLEQLQGQWINNNYLEKLHKTRSHYRAMCEVPAFYISLKDSKYNWSIALQFHEGMRYNIQYLKPCSEQNTYELVFRDDQHYGRISGNDKFYFPEGITGNEIQWIFDDIYVSLVKGKKKLSFVRLKPNLEDYINYVLLVGKYSDQNGRTFIFHQSRKAEWPDKSFTYGVSLDTFLSEFSSCEYFYDIDKKNLKDELICYPFKWFNNKLYIYSTYTNSNGSGSLQPQKEPTYILTPY